MTRYDHLWDTIYRLAEDYINNSLGYDHCNPDPLDVIQKNPLIGANRVRGKKMEYNFGEFFPESDSCRIFWRKEDFNSYLPDFDHFQIYGRTTEQIYRRTALAHELGHVFLHSNREHIARIFTECKIVPSRLRQEAICDLFADIFLVPTIGILDALEEFKNETLETQRHPLILFKKMCRHFSVNMRQMLRRMIHVNAFKDWNSFLILFSYMYNPGKHSPLKWRCVPEYILMPSWITSKPPELKFYSSGYHYVGIETLNLCSEELADEPNWRVIYRFYENNRSHDGVVPWSELNPIGPRGGVVKNKLSITKHYHEHIPLSQLIDKKEMSNLNYILYATDLDCVGWNPTSQHNASYMLVGGNLNLRTREK